MPAIMYCCDECIANEPDRCAYVDRSQLRVTPNGNWLCQSCYEEGSPEAQPDWNNLTQPPEYIPAA